MTGPLILLAAMVFAAQDTVPTPRPRGDSAAALVRRAERAEWEYERTARMRAPVSFAGAGGGPCDEVVGRFCLRFDRGDHEPPPPAEPPAVGDARVKAIAALERAAAAAPTDARVARGLVRLLVESRRDSAAVAAAARFGGASGGLWPELLQAFALHAAGDDTAAEKHFTRAYSLLGARERRRLRIDKLLAPGEASALRRLTPSARAGYEAALWKLADPLYLTPGNEVRGEHLARYTWGRMLSELPVVRGMTSWGDDLEELTFRYGVPTARERVPAQFFDERDNMIEHYDEAQLPFLPESLLVAGVRPPPPPGDPWTLDDPAARSGYAPVTVRRVVSLPVQLTRFFAGDSIAFRVDAALPLDSIARRPRAGGRGARPEMEAALYLLPAPELLLRGDTAPRLAVTAVPRLESDSVRASFLVALPPGRYVYSAEMLEQASRLAGRSRYLVELKPPPPSGPLLSDLLVAEPFGSLMPTRRDDPLLRALPEALAAPGDTLGLYAEGTRLGGGQGGMYRVDLRLQPAQPPSPPGRLMDWLRRRLGSPATGPVRASWTGEARAGAPVALATDLVLPRVRPGLYTLRLRLTDLATGAAAESDRLLRVRRPR